MGGRIFSVKMVAGSAAFLSAAVALRLAIPAVTDFLAAEAPRVYGSVTAWLTPPYLYFVINGIIISIAATSRFQKTAAASSQQALDPVLSATPPPISTEVELLATVEYISKVAEDADLQPESLAPAVDSGEAMNLSIVAADPDPEPEEFVISRSTWSPSRRGSSDALLEKSTPAVVDGGGTATERPSISVRLGRRRSIKSSPEGKTLGVARSRKHETLESTWRTITDGRAVPLARHHKKSDTWDMHARSAAADPALPAVAMRKSETFAVGSSAAGFPSPSSGSGGSSTGKLRREPSLGQDDLNRRVEAFINKFNEEMRLQRQQSLQQYMDMINRSGQ